MVTIKTLEKTEPLAIFQCLAAAFEHYYLPLSTDPAVHLERWKNAQVDFSLSYGAFAQEKLLGFVLIATQGKDAFNLATGVIPAARGQKLTQKIFAELIPHLKSLDYQRLSLEVIQQNERALQVYQQNGFTIARSLLSFKGKMLLPKMNCAAHYYLRPYFLKREHLALAHFAPSFEQSFDLLYRRKHLLELHELRFEDKLQAFALYSPSSSTLVYLAGQDELTQVMLLDQMKLNGENIGIINVDERNKPLIQLLTKVGLDHYISQYEMYRAL